MPTGYTLLEMLLAVMVLSILSAIGALGWSRFRENHALNHAQSEVAQVMRGARETAKRQSQDWQAGFRITANNAVQWATYPATADPNQVQWQSLNSAVSLSDQTTLDKTGANIYRVVFNHKGHVNGQLGKVVLTSRSDSGRLRCVVVSTLLGAMRNGNTANQCATN